LARRRFAQGERSERCALPAANGAKRCATPVPGVPPPDNAEIGLAWVPSKVRRDVDFSSTEWNPRQYAMSKTQIAPDAERCWDQQP